MASFSKTNRRRSSSKTGSSRSDAIDCDLPIRTPMTPISKLPSPSTLPTNQSTASSSSSSSVVSARVFDYDSESAVRPGSPTTPQDDLMNTLDDTIILSPRDQLEDSPLLDYSRHSKRRTLARVQPSSRSGTISLPRFSSPGPQETSRSLPQSHADILENDSAIAETGLDRKNLQETEIVEIFDDESEEGTSSIDDHENIDAHDSLLGSEDEQYLDGDGSDHESDEENAILDIESDGADISEHDPEETNSESVGIRFTRYGVTDRSVCSINQSILKTIRKQRKVIKSPGTTYIYESPNLPGHLKIGRTTNMNDRKKTLLRCEKLLTQVSDHDENPFHFHSIVESLVHEELSNRRRFLVCHCGKKHKEYFEVPKEGALKSVSRWRTWIKVQKPYNKHGQLRPYWQWKVENLETTLACVDWDKWVQPNPRDHMRYWYILEEHFERKDKQFLVVGSILLSCMTLLYGRNCFVVIFLALVLI